MVDAMPQIEANTLTHNPDYAAVIGRRVLEDGFLLAFDAGDARLVHANDSAIFLLEMSEDGLSDHSFSTLFDRSGEDLADLWAELCAGARPRWTGALKATLSGTTVPVNVVAAFEAAGDAAGQVILHAAPIETQDGATSDHMFSGLADYVGVIEYDADGAVISGNERAETALEFFGDGLIGQSLDKLWPKSETLKLEYSEFWDKLRQGRIVEGLRKHVSSEGNTVWLQSTYVPIRDDLGSLKSVKQCLMDVTDLAMKAKQDAALVDSIRDAAFMVAYDGEGHVCEASESACTLFEHLAADIVGKSMARLLHPEFQRSLEFKELLEKVKAGASVTGDLHHVSSQGTSLWVRSVLFPLLDNAGAVDGFVEIAFDITHERNRLQDLEARYAIVSDVMGVMDISASGEILAANKRHCIELGLYEEDLVGKDYKSVLPRDVTESIEHQEMWEKTLAGETVSSEARWIGKGGKEFWRKSTYAPLRSNRDERVRKIMCFGRSTAQEKQQALELSAKVTGIEAVLGIAEYSPEGMILEASSSYLDALGYTLEEIKGKDSKVFLPPETADSDDHSMLWTRLRAGEIRRIEDRRVTKGRGDIWLDMTFVPVKDSRGHVVRVLEFSHDVTERAATTHRLKQKIEAADGVFGIVEFDDSGTIQAFNDGFLRMIGYSARGLADQHHSILCAAEESTSQAYRDFWLALARGESRSGKFNLRGHMGREITVVGSYMPIRDQLGEVARVALFTLDVTDFDHFRDLSLKAAGAAIDTLNDLLASQAVGEREIGALSEALLSSRKTIETGKVELDGGVSEFKGIRDAIKLIQETVAMVNEIATQTNLLAFNAAIEAARVGKNGEGFSIVADEVRRLAERNSNAARVISEQVKVISERMASGAKGSETAAVTITEGGALLADILEKMKTLATVTTEQHEKASESAKAIAQISKSA